jgi:hypothetical protein
MTENMILDTEINSKTAVMQAVKHFARALAETPQIQAFEVRATFQEKEQGLVPTCPNCRGRNVDQVMTPGLFIGQSNAFNPGRNAGACRPNARPGCCG